MAIPASFENLLRFFLRWSCPGCGAEIERTRLLCPWCALRITPCGVVHGSRDGRPLGMYENMRSDPRSIPVYSATLYHGLPGEILRRLKFNGEKHLASVAAALTVEHAVRLPGPGDLLVPVPVAPGRRRERGYNQVLLIARELVSTTGCELGDVLYRDDGPSQVGLTPEERRKNVRGVFHFKGKKSLEDLRIWILDDVATTFSTIHSASGELRRAGARGITGLTVTYRRRLSGSIIPY